jgi:hypothetical protein
MKSGRGCLTMEEVFGKSSNIVWREVQGEAVLLNPENGRYFGLNSVGCSFWEKVDGTRTVNEIIDLLMEEYEVAKDILAADIKRLVNNMSQNGILIIKGETP